MRRTRTLAALLLLALALPARDARAQAAPRWKEIGKTQTGNPVYIDPRSIVKKEGITTATVRVVYAEPVATPQGAITGQRVVAMFDCGKMMLAVKENIIWHDEKKGTMYRKSAPKIPGYGPAFIGTFADVAMKHLCTGPGAAAGAPATKAPAKTPTKAP